MDILRRPGRIVKHKTKGWKGYFYNDEEPVNGKLRVYTVGGKKFLCDPKNLKMIGFIN